MSSAGGGPSGFVTKRIFYQLKEVHQDLLQYTRICYQLHQDLLPVEGGASGFATS